MQRYNEQLLIDEIQYAPGLLPLIKMRVDENRQPDMFWLTGSQKFHLMKGISESLAGRVAVLELFGLTLREMNQQGQNSSCFLPSNEFLSIGELSRISIFERIWRGSLPEIALRPELNWEMFYNSYLQTYLKRDINDLVHISNEMAFNRFLKATAARTASLLNLSDLARDADIAVNTAKNWLSLLITTGICFLLQPYYSNLTKRFVKSPKLYFMDTGLAAFLTGWSSSTTLESGAMAGQFFETWVVGEIYKSFTNVGLEPPIYFFRNKYKKEIDLLILRDGKLYPDEIKMTASPGKKDLRNFHLLQNLNKPRGEGAVICLVNDILPLSDMDKAFPVSVL